MLPGFIIIGAARSGTTSVYHSLSEHPDVFMPLRKEPSFFSQNWYRGLDWYQNFFLEQDGQQAVGEASVSYTFPKFTESPERIANLLPDVRLVYIVRNPIQRTYSHYLYYRHYAMSESLEFEDALGENPVYLGASSYHAWVERYLEYFDREQLLVLLLEDFMVDSAAILRRIFCFLDIDCSFVPTSAMVRTNAGFRPRYEQVYRIYRRFSLSKPRVWLESLLPQHLRPVIRNRVHMLLGSQANLPTMSTSTRAYLYDYFESDVRNLERFLERDLMNLWQLA